MEIKGTAVMAIRDFVKNKYTSEYNKWIGSLPQSSKSIFLDAIDSSHWYSLDAGGLEPTKKIAECFFGGDYKVGAWTAGQYSAEKALKGIYKIFVMASSPGYIIQRASRIFATYYRPCVMQITEKHDHGVTLEISNMTQSDEVIEYRIAGWIQTALEISGAKNVNIDIVTSIARSDENTCMKIKWD